MSKESCVKYLSLLLPRQSNLSVTRNSVLTNGVFFYCCSNVILYFFKKLIYSIFENNITWILKTCFNLVVLSAFVIKIVYLYIPHGGKAREFFKWYKKVSKRFYKLCIILLITSTQCKSLYFIIHWTGKK